MENYPMIGRTDFDGLVKETINARDLHAFLQSKRQYADWIKAKLNKVGFREGIDYLLHKFVKQVSEKRHGGHNKFEYFITIDTAKQISMMENTQVGYEYRSYLIERDDRLRNIDEGLAAPAPKSGLNHPPDMDMMLEKMVMVRETRRTKGKAAASQIWDWLGLPEVEPEAVQKARQPMDVDTECGRLFEDLLCNETYVALSVAQIIRYIQHEAVGRIKEREIKRHILRANLPSLNVKVNYKTWRVKILSDDHVTNDEIRASVSDFECKYR